MILDINKSTYYYNSELFQPHNRQTIFSHMLKKKKANARNQNSAETEEFKDTTSELTKNIIYVKAPISEESLITAPDETLSAIFGILDQHVLHSETAREDLCDFKPGQDEDDCKLYSLFHI